MASNLDILLTALNKSGIQQTNQPLYQVISQLIKKLKELESLLATATGGGGGSTTNIINITEQFINPLDAYLSSGDRDTFYIPVGTESSPTPSSGDDYVVLSDGGLPTPLPVDDGFGNFIYIIYTP